MKFVKCRKTILKVYDCDIFDEAFYNRLSFRVQRFFFQSFTDDPSGVLSKPLQYEEATAICSKLPLVFLVLPLSTNTRSAGPILLNFFVKTLPHLFRNLFVSTF